MASERKIWVPLESNPEVMTSLAHTLGLSESFALFDIYTIDQEFLPQTDIPRPILSLLFSFPLTETNEKAFDEEEALQPAYTGSGPDEPAMYFHQTIGHACGLIGLLHCLTNTAEVKPHILPGSTLDDLIKSTTPLPRAARAQWLYDSQALEKAHKEHAQRGDSVAPSDPANWNDGQGFVAFVKGKDGHLYELEGRRKGPMDRGLMEEGADMLSESVLKRTVLEFMEREKAAGNGELKFGLLGLARVEKE